MRYLEAKEYLEEITKYGSVLGLDSIRELLERLNNPQDNLKFVHVAGTNGKGSTVAFTTSILRKAGYKTGRYTSPCVFSYREKIQVDESYISRIAFAEITSKIKDVIQEMCHNGLPHPTIFEVETAIAFMYFVQESCDVVVMEAGLGGLWDATNIVENTLVAVLTSISMDHMEFLGSTIEEIADNKAGIIKNDAIVVSTEQNFNAMDVIGRKCKEGNNTLIIASKNHAEEVRNKDLQVCFDYKEYKNIEIGLLGNYQIENAILSIEVVHALTKRGFNISSEAILLGLKQTVWPGRFTVIRKDPLIIIDGAHNEAAAISLKETILTHLKNKRLLFVIGVFADKDYESILKITASLACLILTVTIPNNIRALDGKELAKTAARYHNNVQFMPSLEKAAQVCLNKKDVDAIIAFGSLSYLAQFTECIESML